LLFKLAANSGNVKFSYKAPVIILQTLLIIIIHQLRAKKQKTKTR